MGDELYEQLDSFFHPRSMAVVGVTDKIGNMGMSFLAGFAELGFPGKLYAINPNRKIKDYDSYPSIMDVPGHVDYVKIAVPNTSIPGVIKECAEKGVKCATIFASGFRESGTREGMELEEEVIKIAKEGGVRLIGPNCMGIHYPDGGMTIRGDMPALKGGGDISLAAQSGGMAISLSMALYERGIPIKKAISYGNELDLGPPELLYYLARDPETKVIALYVEGTKRPEALKEAIADAASKKPLVILKGGMTGTGSRAVASHTGALTGTAHIWSGMARQAGAVMVEDFDELVDQVVTCSLMDPPKGKKVCLLTISGGFGVYATDQVINAGFEMPELSKRTMDEFGSFVDAPGTSIHNPIDMAAQFFQPDKFQEMFTILNNDENMDAFILVCATEYVTFLGKNQHSFADYLLGAVINGFKVFDKPVYIAYINTIGQDVRLIQEKNFLKAGYPVFSTVKRCMRAISRSMSLKV